MPSIVRFSYAAGCQSAATLHCNIHALDVTELPQAFVKSNGPWDIVRAGIQYADKRELSLLLGVSSKRPRNCRAGRCDELAPLHSMSEMASAGLISHSTTSSANARSVDGTFTSIARAVCRLIANVNRAGS